MTTTDRLTEAELAELAQRISERGNAGGWNDPGIRRRLIAAARLANSIDDVLRPLFPALEEDATTFDLAHETARLANEQAEEIAAIQAVLMRNDDDMRHIQQPGTHGVVAAAIAERDATIERLRNARDEARSAAIGAVEDRAQRDAARAALEKAKGLACELLAAIDADVLPDEGLENEWRERLEELDKS